MAVIPFPNHHEIHQKTPQDATRKAVAHPVDVYLGRLSPASRRGFLIALNNIARLFPTAPRIATNWTGLG